MSLPVHWVETLSDVRFGDQVEVVGDEAHHAVVVRRLRVGEGVVLTDGLGRRVTGVVAETGKRRLVVRADDVAETPEPAPSFTVVQALPKGERGELAVEVLTEVGVSAIVPWTASRSVAAWRGERGDKALRRWRATSREAAKQSRRAWWPEVAEPVDTTGAADVVRSADLGLVLHEAADLPLAALAVPDAGSVVVVVGPEGGLTEEEVAELRAAGGQVCRLGAEVLRTSTAGVAAVSALLARTPRWA